MSYRMCGSKCLFMCLGLTCIVGCYLALLPLENEKLPSPKPVQSYVSKLTQKKRLAVIVPFRDRFEELLEFIPHMHEFLNKQEIPFHIFVIHQKDNNRFNRASLINVGFLHTKEDYDYIAMHDVDLLPMNDNLKYTYPEKNPMHISSPQTHPNYHYATFIGGILLIKREHFELVKGMSNNYWGWGLEDDEFYLRLKDAGLQVERPAGITTGPEDTFKHIHDKSHRRRDHRKCYNQRAVTRRRDRSSGLHDVSFRRSPGPGPGRGARALAVDGRGATLLDVHLLCDESRTPWCRCPAGGATPDKDGKAKS